MELKPAPTPTAEDITSLVADAVRDGGWGDDLRSRVLGSAADGMRIKVKVPRTSCMGLNSTPNEEVVARLVKIIKHGRACGARWREAQLHELLAPAHVLGLHTPGRPA